MQHFVERSVILFPSNVLTAPLGELERRVEKMANLNQQGNPMKRFGTPEEAANAVAFLLSSQSSYLTGTELFVDGGLINL